MNASMQKKKSKNKGEQPWKKPSKVSQAPNSRKKKTYIGKKHKSHRITPWVEEGSKDKVKNQGGTEWRSKWRTEGTETKKQSTDTNHA